MTMTVACGGSGPRNSGVAPIKATLTRPSTDISAAPTDRRHSRHSAHPIRRSRAPAGAQPEKAQNVDRYVGGKQIWSRQPSRCCLGSQTRHVSQSVQAARSVTHSEDRVADDPKTRRHGPGRRGPRIEQLSLALGRSDALSGRRKSPGYPTDESTEQSTHPPRHPQTVCSLTVSLIPVHRQPLPLREFRSISPHGTSPHHSEKCARDLVRSHGAPVGVALARHRHR
jgi:hypothetical protein